MKWRRTVYRAARETFRRRWMRLQEKKEDIKNVKKQLEHYKKHTKGKKDKSTQRKGSKDKDKEEMGASQKAAKRKHKQDKGAAQGQEAK